MSTGFETTRTTAELFTPALLGNFREDRHEEVGVTVDQIKAAFVRLATKSCCDADDIAGRNVLVAAAGDDLITGAWATMEQVEEHGLPTLD